jgi:hydrogen peroxide-dependent heme synthase
VTDDVVYAFYPVFRRVREVFVSVEEAVHEWEVAFKQVAGSVSVRGFYSSAGFRPDADFLMWLVSSSPDDLQSLSASLRRTALGRSLDLTHVFLGVVRPPEFNPQHQPAFLRGEDPRRYLCVYPFVRTPEWYLLAAEERARLLREHGEMGREFPDVLPNTTSAFGLTDWEWILAFEADELHRIVDCIRRLRDSHSRRYVKEEVPFVIGIRKPLAEAVADLV